MILFSGTFGLCWQDNDEQFPVRASVSVEEIESKSVKAGRRIEGQEAGGSHLDAIQSSKVGSVKVYHEILAQL